MTTLGEGGAALTNRPSDVHPARLFVLGCPLVLFHLLGVLSDSSDVLGEKLIPDRVWGVVIED